MKYFENALHLTLCNQWNSIIRNKFFIGKKVVTNKHILMEYEIINMKDLLIESGLSGKTLAQGRSDASIPVERSRARQRT